MKSCLTTETGTDGGYILPPLPPELFENLPAEKNKILDFYKKALISTSLPEVHKFLSGLNGKKLSANQWIRSIPKNPLFSKKDQQILYQVNRKALDLSFSF